MGFIDDEFKKLTENAFDFLERALGQIKDEPKYSVINFYTAIELFFKARLLREHWAMILKEPARADKLKFEQGDFLSVSLNECCDRLDGLGGSKKDSYHKEKLCFKKICEQRNKLVHFYDADYFSKGSKTINIIIEEQFTGIILLTKLIEGRWAKFFEGYHKRVDELNSKMKVHREYLQKKFDNLPDSFKGLIAAGKVSKCPVCELNAFVQKELDEPFIHKQCVVCEHEAFYLSLCCKKCKCKYSAPIGEQSYDCPDCGSEYLLKDLCEDYGVGKKLSPKEYYDIIDTNCACCGSDNIIESDMERYYCIDCGEFTRSLSSCEYCGQRYIGEIEDETLYSGCMMCDGLKGNMRDKD